jgi:hypothetical protein
MKNMSDFEKETICKDFYGGNNIHSKAYNLSKGVFLSKKFSLENLGLNSVINKPIKRSISFENIHKW